ncbi:hypothetical protein PLIIFM63780_003387 [Purpureocillium lilacinum]|nr:hypothetical protein PLIIFM63780_003387 [Purpureocillium lilacinum]
MRERARTREAAATLASVNNKASRAMEGVVGTAAAMPPPIEAAEVAILGQFRNVERLTYESARNENNKAVARGTLQNNRGGGSQDNGADLPNVPHGKIMTVTDGQNAVGVINQVIHNSGSKRALLFCMPDERAEVKRIKIARDSGEGYGNSAGALTVWHPGGVGGGPGSEDADTNEDEQVTGGKTMECCGSCGQYTHELESCVRPEKDGTLHGCPMCNCSGHNVEECSQWAKMSLEEKFTVLVDNRGRMVPLYTAKEELWYQILERRCRRKGESLGMPECFPYTREFGKGFCEDEEELRCWEDFYEMYDHSILPVDNKTRDAKSVRKLFSGAAYQSAPSRSEEQTMEIDYYADVNADGDPEGEAEADDLMSVEDDGGNGKAAPQDKVADLAQNLGATTLAKNGKVEGRVKTAPLPAQDEDLIYYFDMESDI